MLGPLSFSNMVNNIKPVNPLTQLIKCADITASVPGTIGLNHTDSSHQEVANIKSWADDNMMKLNMKKIFEMPLPKSISGIGRKSELQLLGVTANADRCNWDAQFKIRLVKRVLDCTSLEFANTTATHYKSLHCCLTAL